ncbi:MAG: molybdopterin-guanine dinucleotide biosynthesis protein B [Leptospirales bacterium]|nr:molybdopterin-guanine dinucleotide biosynthesis protein B [Leptospirales bacterium]
MSHRIISITGRSGSGKTTLIEKLIVYYNSIDENVSVLKSMRHDFDTDPVGKDTYRYRESGARASLITNGKKFSLISKLDSSDENPIELAARYFNKSDIIIIEGFKQGNLKKIEVIGDSIEAPLFTEDPGIKILVTDKFFETSLPIYKRDDIQGIIKAIDRFNLLNTNL